MLAEETERLKDILEELRILLKAESVGYIIEPHVKESTDCTIKLYGCQLRNFKNE